MAEINVANDLAVRLFLKEKISFNLIPILIEETMNKHKYIFTTLSNTDLST